MVLRHTLYDTDAAAAALWRAAHDLPGAEGFIGNVRACADDAEALAAFTQTVRQQARKR